MLANIDDNSSWYVVRVISGKERKIKLQLQAEIERSKWQEAVLQILVPTEKVFQMKKGKKVIKERNYLPGYILIEVVPEKFHGDIIQTIKNMNGIINFLGKQKPEPIRKNEVLQILGKVEELSSTEKIEEPFIVGETIKVIDGPFSNFLGVIEEIFDDRKKLKVTIRIFGRPTIVELTFTQIEKQEILEQ